MFDNPMFIEPPPAAPRRRPFACAVGLAIAVLALAPWRTAVVISAPTHLRQISVVSTAGANTDFYLTNAGFRSRRARRLLASADGGGSLWVVWLGPDQARVQLGRGWSNVLTQGNQGVRVDFVTGR